MRSERIGQLENSRSVERSEINLVLRVNPDAGRVPVGRR